MANEKKQFSKVTTFDQRVFYTRELDRAQLLTLPDVQRVEDVWMTEEEYEAIEPSAEARSFFSGEPKVRGRAD
jgi:hypothetical protein